MSLVPLFLLRQLHRVQDTIVDAVHDVSTQRLVDRVVGLHQRALVGVRRAQVEVVLPLVLEAEVDPLHVPPANGESEPPHHEVHKAPQGVHDGVRHRESEGGVVAEEQLLVSPADEQLGDPNWHSYRRVDPKHDNVDRVLFEDELPSLATRNETPV